MKSSLTAKLRSYKIVKTTAKLLRYKALQSFYKITPHRNVKRQICMLPWTHAAIKSDGQVTCATASRGQKELFFGNLEKSTFSEIWHGTEYQAIRQSMVNPLHKLPYLCYTCPYKSEYKDLSSLSLKPKFPTEIWLEATDSCSLCCPLCLSSTDRKNSYLPFKIFSKLINEIGPHLHTLHFFLDGENYLHPEATKMTSYAKMVNPNITIYTSTNGLHFNSIQKQKEFLKSGIDIAVFSIDGATQETYSKYRVGGKLDQVLNSLKAIVSLRDQMDIPMTINWRYILFEWNDSEHQMDLARKLATDIGVDSLIWLITTSSYKSRRFSISKADEYPTKIPNEYFEGTFTGIKENLFKQKLQ